jgi:hypothetical protein
MRRRSKWRILSWDEANEWEGGEAVDQNNSNLLLKSNILLLRSDYITYHHLCSDMMIIIIVVITTIIIINFDSYYLVELAASLPHKSSSIHLFDSIQYHQQTPITIIVKTGKCPKWRKLTYKLPAVVRKLTM